jgi:hypothetical protein
MVIVGMIANMVTNHKWLVDIEEPDMLPGSSLWWHAESRVVFAQGDQVFVIVKYFAVGILVVPYQLVD